MKKLLPVFLALLGLAIGTGAGFMLHEPKVDECAETPCAPVETAAPTVTEPSEYAKMNNQFIVPDVHNGAVISLVVLSVSIETAPGTTEKVFAVEPKLRDTFLQILFDHANAGGFRGEFTSAATMEDLRRALLEGAHNILGEDVRAVLISDIMRQDAA